MSLTTSIVLIILAFLVLALLVVLIRTINRSNTPIGTLHVLLDNNDSVQSVYLRFDKLEDIEKLKRQHWVTFKLNLLHECAK